MLKFEELLVFPSQNIQESMNIMTKNRRGIVFVCDENNVLLGVVSDGEIRRALLEGSLPMTPIRKVMNTDPVIACDAKEANELLKAKNYVAIPILNQERQLTEIALSAEDQAEYLKPAVSFPSTVTSQGKEESQNIVVIPARKGSKRFPGKNIALVAGKPLVAWAILVAKQCPSVSKVIVTTDDPAVKEIAESLGVAVPWMRPKELSGDQVPTVDVLLHALEKEGQNEKSASIGLLLEPTAPLREISDIEEAIEQLRQSGADSVASVCEVPHTLNPEELLKLEGDALTPYAPNVTMGTRNLRGNQKSSYVQTGLVYAFQMKSLFKNKCLYGQKTIPLLTSWNRFLDIDTHDDLKVADARIRYLQAQKNVSFS